MVDTCAVRETLTGRALSPRWGGGVILVGSCFLITSCGATPQFKIHNATADAVVLVGCAQEPNMDRVISPASSFTFSDVDGERTLPDDPGFACVLKTKQGGLMCLTLPTDQNDKAVFDVSEARPTTSFDACVAKSNPHI